MHSALRGVRECSGQAFGSLQHVGLTQQEDESGILTNFRWYNSEFLDMGGSDSNQGLPHLLLRLGSPDPSIPTHAGNEQNSSLDLVNHLEGGQDGGTANIQPKIPVNTCETTDSDSQATLALRLSAQLVQGVLVCVQRAAGTPWLQDLAKKCMPPKRLIERLEREENYPVLISTYRTQLGMLDSVQSTLDTMQATDDISASNPGHARHCAVGSTEGSAVTSRPAGSAASSAAWSPAGPAGPAGHHRHPADETREDSREDNLYETRNDNLWTKLRTKRRRAPAHEAGQEVADTTYFARFLVRFMQQSGKRKCWTANSLISAYREAHPTHVGYKSWIGKGRGSKATLEELLREAFPAENIETREHKVVRTWNAKILREAVVTEMLRIIRESSPDQRDRVAARRNIEAAIEAKWPAVDAENLWLRVNQNATDDLWEELERLMTAQACQ